MDQKFEMVPITDIKSHPENPRRGDISAIDQSISVNGFYGACVVQGSTRFILSGNHRYLAAQRQGATHIPIIVVDVDDATALRMLLVDNRANDLSGYDDAILRLALEQVKSASGTLSGTAFSDQDFDSLIKRLDGVTTSENSGSFQNSEPCPEILRIVIGPFRIDVTSSKYEEWKSQFVQSATAKTEVIKILKERLGL